MKPRLLIAESDDLLRDVYKRLFFNLGYELEMAAHGLECLEKLQRCAPDVLIIDWQMPWGGGDGILEHVRNSIHCLSLEVILLTRENRCELASHCSPPVIACLERPFRMSTLLEAIHRVAAVPV